MLKEFVSVTAGNSSTSLSRIKHTAILGEIMDNIWMLSSSENVCYELIHFMFNSCCEGNYDSAKNMCIPTVGIRWLKNTVNPNVGTNDIFGIKVAYLLRRKEPVLGDIFQCTARHWVRPQNPKLSQSFSGTRVFLQIHLQLLLQQEKGTTAGRDRMP